MTDESPSTAVAVSEEVKRRPAVLEWDPDFARLVKLTVLRPKEREATGTELALFAEQVQRTGLDPFFRQIYGIYRWDSRVGAEVMQVQAGIDGFRLVAERTGRYEGQTPQQWCARDGAWVDVWTAEGNPYAARCGVYKTGRREATYAVAHWAEYVQTDRSSGKPSGKWATMPANQLSKCAEALALRKAFPAELSGLYTVDEMSHADGRTGGEDVAAGTGAGGGEGQTPLPESIEAVLARAKELGHAGIANRAGAAFAIKGQAPSVVDAWVAARTRELDRFAERTVVEPEDVATEEELRVAKAADPEAFAEGGSREARAEALLAARVHLAREFAEPTPEEQIADEAAMSAAMRRRAEEYEEDAAALREAGDADMAAEALAEAAKLRDEAGPDEQLDISL